MSDAAENSASRSIITFASIITHLCVWLDLFMATSIYRCIFCLIPIILLWQESLHYTKFLSAKFNFYEFKRLERNDELKRAPISKII